MADVFISYAREDGEVAAKIAALLEQSGLTVWWDRGLLPGTVFDHEIRRELEGADAVVVLWSPAAAASRWVKGEAEIAAERQVAIPVIVTRVDLPLGHRAIHAVDLSARPFDPRGSEELRIVEAVERMRLRAARTFALAARERIRGGRVAANLLARIAGTGSSFADLARMELACHEFARLGETRSAPLVARLAGEVRHPFARRALALLQCMHHLVSGEHAGVVRLAGEMNGATALSEAEKSRVALHEILVFGTLGEQAALDEAWRRLSDTAPETGAGEYPFAGATREFDRALLAAIYGKDDVEALASELPVRGYRGLAHVTAATSRAVRKSPWVLPAIEARGRLRGWKEPHSVATMRRRCRALERALLPIAGTLFPPDAAPEPAAAP